MAEHQPSAGDAPHTILVIANETCPCPELRDQIRDRAAPRSSRVFIVAPALNERLKHWVSDVDEAAARARDRLGAIIADLRKDGIDAAGEIGDSRPIQAIDDALAERRPDELILSTHPPDSSHWLEKGLLEQAPEHFGGPITHFVSRYGIESRVDGDPPAAA